MSTTSMRPAAGPWQAADTPRRHAVRRAPGPTPTWWRDAAGVTAWASMLVVLALWVANRGVQNLLATGSPGTALTGLGRLAGLISADLLLVQVFLMARVPWVERSYGQDELARRHRLVGFASFQLLIAHIVLVTFGYAAAARSGVLAQLWELVTGYPGMLLATAGTALLVLVVLTSIRAARRRLRYESWHLLHLYAYLGVGLSVPHEVWTGADFTASPWAQAYWWSAYAVAAGSVLAFRLGLPLWRTVRHRLVVERVVAEGPGVVSLHLRGRKLDRLPVRAGQFFVWRFLDGPGASRANPYSLSAAPQPNLLRITAKDLGDGSGRLAALRPGTRVLIEGPYGRLTGAVRTRRKVTMLACGIGITPLRALLEELDYAPGEATLVYRTRSAADVVFRHELDELAARRGVRVHYVPGPRIRDPDRRSWLPESARGLTDHEALTRLVPDIAGHDIYACGPQDWTEAVSAAAHAAGVPAGALHVERFDW